MAPGGPPGAWSMPHSHRRPSCASSQSKCRSGWSCRCGQTPGCQTGRVAMWAESGGAGLNWVVGLRCAGGAATAAPGNQVCVPAALAYPSMLLTCLPFHRAGRMRSVPYGTGFLRGTQWCTQARFVTHCARQGWRWRSTQVHVDGGHRRGYSLCCAHLQVASLLKSTQQSTLSVEVVVHGCCVDRR